MGVLSGGSRRAGVRVLDVGCGANLIYPLLGAAMHGWAFVGADVTDAAMEWAKRNRAANPHLAALLEVRRSAAEEASSGVSCCAGLPVMEYEHAPDHSMLKVLLVVPACMLACAPLA